MKSDTVLAQHILEAIHRVESYTNEVTKEAFLRNFMIQDAVVRNLLIIGEASRNISPITKNKYPEIPWQDIIAMRNILVHEYFRSDAETIWNVVELDLDDLKSYALKIQNP